MSTYCEWYPFNIPNMSSLKEFGNTSLSCPLMAFTSHWPLGENSLQDFHASLFPGGLWTWIASSSGRCDDHCARMRHYLSIFYIYKMMFQWNDLVEQKFSLIWFCCFACTVHVKRRDSNRGQREPPPMTSSTLYIQIHACRYKEMFCPRKRHFDGPKQIPSPKQRMLNHVKQQDCLECRTWLRMSSRGIEPRSFILEADAMTTVPCSGGMHRKNGLNRIVVAIISLGKF
jgi:hypothetical protein